MALLLLIAAYFALRSLARKRLGINGTDGGKSGGEGME
jgi:hypothetical protein